jgi:drug/metabolite transporter (DMT)-like permease
VAVAAVLFGTTFVTVQAAVEDVEPVPFLAVRFLIGAAALAPFALRNGRGQRQQGLWRAGAACGVALLAGYLFQTVGLQYTSSTVSAFITYLLVVLVPLIAAVAGRRLPTAGVAAGVALSVAGLALLTGGASGAGFGRGEALTLGCAFAFALHIVVLGDVAPRFDTVRLNAVQLATVGGLCLIPGFFLGGYRFTTSAWIAAIFTALAATALAFALQVYGQRRVGPTRTALLLMIEPVSAAALGWFSGDRLRWSGVAGAVLILGGIALAELPLFARRAAP